jgi:hypothetical protein
MSAVFCRIDVISPIAEVDRTGGSRASNQLTSQPGSILRALEGIESSSLLDTARAGRPYGGTS